MFATLVSTGRLLVGSIIYYRLDSPHTLHFSQCTTENSYMVVLLSMVNGISSVVDFGGSSNKY